VDGIIPPTGERTAADAKWLMIRPRGMMQNQRSPTSTVSPGLMVCRAAPRRVVGTRLVGVGHGDAGSPGAREKSAGNATAHSTLIIGNVKDICLARRLRPRMQESADSPISTAT